MYLLLFGFWLILNGRITMEIIIFGLVLSAAVYAFICRFMGYSIQKELSVAKKLPLIIAYIFLLISEIIKANICMFKQIMDLSVEPEPALIHFKVNLKTDLARVVLANSITLTPGTITVDLHEDEYVVHCYDKSMGDGIEASAFVKLLERLEA